MDSRSASEPKNHNRRFWQRGLSMASSLQGQEAELQVLRYRFLANKKTVEKPGRKTYMIAAWRRCMFCLEIMFFFCFRKKKILWVEIWEKKMEHKLWKVWEKLLKTTPPRCAGWKRFCIFQSWINLGTIVWDYFLDFFSFFFVFQVSNKQIEGESFLEDSVKSGRNRKLQQAASTTESCKSRRPSSTWTFWIAHELVIVRFLLLIISKGLCHDLDKWGSCMLVHGVNFHCPLLY